MLINPNTPMATSQGFTTEWGSLPDFPYIGAFDDVAFWNSPACGTCWRLSFEGRSIDVLAVDNVFQDIIISLEAMDMLTGGRGIELGVIDVSYRQVGSSACGL